MSSIEDILNKFQKDESGNFHPINNIKDFLISILENIGFEHIEGAEIESERFNFDMLNIKKSHPARQMHDTFYVEKKELCIKNSYITSTNSCHA